VYVCVFMNVCSCGVCVCVCDVSDLVQWLVSHGADPNKQNMKGNTPLHFAVCCMCVRMCVCVHVYYVCVCVCVCVCV